MRSVVRPIPELLCSSSASEPIPAKTEALRFGQSNCHLRWSLLLQTVNLIRLPRFSRSCIRITSLSGSWAAKSARIPCPAASLDTKSQNGGANGPPATVLEHSIGLVVHDDGQSFLALAFIVSPLTGGTLLPPSATRSLRARKGHYCRLGCPDLCRFQLVSHPFDWPRFPVIATSEICEHAITAVGFEGSFQVHHPRLSGPTSSEVSRGAPSSDVGEADANVRLPAQSHRWVG
jgi:hypothetical protein